MNTAEHLAGEPAISVIVPIYNVEPYLGECPEIMREAGLRMPQEKNLQLNAGS